MDRVAGVSEAEDVAVDTLDALYIDEELVDARITGILAKQPLTRRQIGTLVIFIRYKRLIIAMDKENEDCDNENLVSQILSRVLQFPSLRDENFAELLKALDAALCLNFNNLEKLTEHYTQQLLSSPEIFDENSEKLELHLSVVNCFLKMCIFNEVQVSSRFILNDVEAIIRKSNDSVDSLLFSNIIPKIIVCSGEPFILNVIWDFIISKPFTRRDFKMLCTLSDYFFFSEHSKRLNMLSTLTKDEQFWNMIRHGFANDDIFIRKCGIFLANRAISTICESQHSTIITVQGDPNPIIFFEPKNRTAFETDWKDLFTLLETLEEKQSHLVLAAMNLSVKMKSLHDIWLCCVISIALDHDTESVKMRAIEVALSLSLDMKYFPIEKLLISLNNVFIYDVKSDFIVEKMEQFLNRGDDVVVEVIKHAKNVDWSPIPKFYLTRSIRSIKDKTIDLSIAEVIENLCNKPYERTNNHCIQSATNINLIYFIMGNEFKGSKIEDLILIFTTFQDCVTKNNEMWEHLVSWAKNVNTKNKLLPEGVESLTLTKVNSGRSTAILLLLLRDAGVISEDSWHSYLKKSFATLQQSVYREYGSKDEFMSVLLFIASVIENDLEEVDQIIIINHIDSLFTFVCHHLQTIDTFENANLITKCLEKVLSNESISESVKSKMVLNLIYDEIVNSFSSCDRDAKKYFNVVLLSTIYPYRSDSSNKRITLNNIFDFKCTNEGKINCDYYEALSKLQYNILKQTSELSKDEIEILYSRIEELLEIGGYNCTLYLIQSLTSIYVQLHDAKGYKKCEKLLNSIWKNIMDIRKSDQFKYCIQAFIELLFVNGKGNEEITTEYINELFELGDQTPIVIYELVDYVASNIAEINEKYTHLILSKAVLFGNVLRKDQRVENELCQLIESQRNLSSLKKTFVPYISTMIRKKAVDCLAVSEILSNEVTKIVKNNLMEAKIKSRYHDNTVQHRFLLRSLQILLMNQKFNLDGKCNTQDVEFCSDLLKNQPHPSSIKILLEWYLILSILREFENFEEYLQTLDILSLPLTSAFTIVYHVVKNKILDNDPKTDQTIMRKNLSFVLELLSKHTMGPSFNIRLYAQYLFLQLLGINKDEQITKEYTNVKEIISETLKVGADEKNLINLQNDFYINEFNPVSNLTVDDIYYKLPKLYDISREEWISFGKEDSNDNLKIGHEIADPVFQPLMCVQKKFVPWKVALADLQISTEDPDEQKETKTSDLIVVASLIDKLPNLGGLSRTCEVFGVKKYIIDSIRHVQDKQFQSLSVSAENWLKIIEVRPGDALKEFLVQMKSHGYCIIGIEQTSSSVSLNEFKFPNKSLILLGHEKEGVPCDLLNLVDFCVEIPQSGMIRSLNVHVAASIFIWEYQKQHGFAA